MLGWSIFSTILCKALTLWLLQAGLAAEADSGLQTAVLTQISCPMQINRAEHLETLLLGLCACLGNRYFPNSSFANEANADSDANLTRFDAQTPAKMRITVKWSCRWCLAKSASEEFRNPKGNQ